MIIKHIEAIPLLRELEDVFHGGTFKITSRNTLVTRVELDNGIVGETFGGDEDQYHFQVCRVVNDIYRPLLVGGDVRDVELHWERMWSTQVDLHNRGIHTLDLAKHCVLTQAIAAVDIALWDALGKSLGQPVYKLLGGYRDRVPVIGTAGYFRDTDDRVSLEREIEHLKERQLYGMKLKVGKHPIEEEIERVRFARKIGGPDFHICIDSNQSWTVADAMKFARGVQDLNLAWLEEPVRWYDQIEGNARLRTLGIPVCAGQGEISRYGCRDLVARGAVDILNVDATIAAGVTEWRRIAGMASCFGVSMAHHEEPQVSLHLLASVPHGLCVEIFPSYQRDPMWFDLPVQQPEIKEGHMNLPKGPGFGIQLREEVIEKYRGDKNN
ncbi:MAG: mandelate racemase/muconate lactonizing enzyme family protein [Pseudomonadota bacterium]